MHNQKTLGIFALAMISVAGIVNLRSLPFMASYGYLAVFFYIVAAIGFLLPSAFVCAELATGWPKAGGVYLWVKEAFGPFWGFCAVWLEWINNVIAFPTTLSAIAAGIAYVIDPKLASHPAFIFTMILTILWVMTFYNFLGIKAASRLNIIGGLCGTLIPAAVIITLGVIWLSLGKHTQVHWSWQTVLPHWHIGELSFFVGTLSAYAGMQITAFHAQNVKNPTRDYPKAIFIATGLILAATILGTLAIAIVVPKAHLSLVAGLLEGFSGFFSAFHLTWAIPVLALLTVLGGCSTLSAWLLAPARGLAVAASCGDFPDWFAKTNRNEMPTRILLLQAVISSFLACVFLFANSLSTGFWLLMVLTSQFTLMMYVLLFCAAIRLRYSKPDVQRTYRVPGGHFGLWLIGGIGAVFAMLGIIAGFIPPKLAAGHVASYEAFVIVGNLVYLSIPVLLYQRQRRSSLLAVQ